MKLAALLLIALLGKTQFTPMAQAAQSACTGMIKPGPYIEWDKALICGVSPQASSMAPLHKLGLSHLIVVSGAHLIFVETLLVLIFSVIGKKPGPFLTLVFLCGYSLCAGLQAPVVRALFQRSLFKLQGWNTLCSGMLAWLFFRELSMSLALSWACALAMAWPTQKLMGPWIKSLLIHLSLLPLLISLGAPTVWSTLINPFAIFIFGVLLFPVAILNLILPISLISNFLWREFLWVTQEFATKFGATDIHSNWIPYVIYLLMLQFLFIYMEIERNRKKLWV